MKLFTNTEKYLIIICSSLIFSEFYFFIFNSRALISVKYLLINTINLFIFSTIFFFLFFFLIEKAFKFLSINKIKNIFMIYFTFIFFKIIQIPFYYGNLVPFKTIVTNLLKSIIFKELYFLLPFLKISVPFLVLYLLIRFLFTKYLKETLRFFYFFSLIFCLIMSWNISKRLPTLENIEINTNVSKSNRQVIWIVFDEYDPEYFIDNKFNIDFKNIKKLTNSSLTHYKTFPPSDSTLISVTSTFLKTKSNGSIIEDYQLKILNKKNKKISFSYENTFFKNLNENNFTFKIISETLPYCAMLKIEGNCEKNPNQLKHYFEGIKQSFGIKYISKLKNMLIKNNKFDIEKLKNFNEKNKYDEIVLSTYLDINLDNFDQILRQKDNLIFFHFDIPHTNMKTSKYIEQFFDMTPASDPEEYILNLQYTDIIIKYILEIIENNNNEDILLLLTSDHWKRGDSPLKAKPALFIAKIKGDTSKEEIYTDNLNIFIPDLAYKYLNKEINTHKDLKVFFKSLPKFDKNETYINKN